jgi:ABC-type Mn2+/Zn2+ transport system ATPase subunit
MCTAVEVEGLVVAYRRRAVLHGVSLQVGDGHLVGLFGHNGAGKSTLLKAVIGLVRAEAGVVRVYQRQVTGPNLRRIRMETAYVPQTLGVDPRMPVTALDVALMGRYGVIGLLRRVGRQDVEAAMAALSEVGAAHLAPRPFGQLSGGEQQRVLVARALAQAPRLLLLDEPTNSLDWQSQQRLAAVVRTVHAERGLTTMVVSHDLGFLAATCDRILLMRDGRIDGEVDPSDVSLWPHPSSALKREALP